MSQIKVKVLDCFASEFPAQKLSTVGDVIKAFCFKRKQLSILKEVVIKILVDEICTIWKRSMIPIVSYKTVTRRVSTCVTQYLTLAKSDVSREIKVKKVNSFKLTSRKLFDIAFCNCYNLRKCDCADENKVPLEQTCFLADQRSTRKMVLNFKSYLVENSHQYPTKSVRFHEPDEDAVLNCGKETSSKFDSSTDNSNSYDQLNYAVPKNVHLRSRFIEYTHTHVGQYNNVEMPETAKAADRYTVSDRAVAAISTATLIDFGIVSCDNPQLIVDPSKVRRNRKRKREMQIDELKFDDIQGLYFDGRKDDTLEYVNGAKKTIKQEHISFVHQPNSFYIGHETVPDGCAESIADKAEKLLKGKNIQISKKNAMGCDGTVVNTGTGDKGGVIQKLELRWKKTLQWIICMLHLIELPLRSLFEKLDGKTTGSKTFSGPLGKRLDKCEQQKIVKFTPIKFKCNVPNIDSIAHTMSTDQRYLFDMCTAISNGVVSARLASRAIGPICHSRWTTLANRLLRVYVSDPKPSLTLETLVKYILFVYAPAMFKIKYQSSIVFGSVHLATIVQSCRFLPKKELNIVKESIQRNSYFAHPENVTLAMLNDDDKMVRERGWRNILLSRESKNEPIRKFKVPRINFNCDSYVDLIDLTKADPPILRNVEINEENIDLLANEKILDHDFGSFLKDMPSHTQSVERCVQLVTEGSKKVCTEEARDGIIANTLASRNVMPRFNTKKDYAFGETVLTHLKL